MPDDKPCPCWAEVSLHSGHCCLRNEQICHQEEGLQIHRAYLESKDEAIE